MTEHHDSHEPLPEGEEAPPAGVRTMAVARWILVAAMAAVAVVSWLGYEHSRPKPAAHDDHADAAVHAEKWVCPMHPQIVRDGPGECPICHMDLVKVDTSESHGGSAVHGLTSITLTDERIQLVGMKTATVERRAFSDEIHGFATLGAPEDSVVRIQTRYAGWIDDVRVTQTGQQVKKGQLLAKITSPELIAAQQELLNARRWSGTHEGSGGQLVSDAKKKLELLGLDDADIEKLVASGKSQAAIEIRAPISGSVTRKQAVQGTTVSPGSELFEIADLSRIWILADVSERDAAKVTLGAKAEVRLAAFDGTPIVAKVTFIEPALDPATRTLRVRLTPVQASVPLKPGMSGELTMQGETSQALVIPREALIDTGSERYVFVRRADGAFEPRPVKTGRRSGELVEVLDGLTTSEVVVTTGNFLLDSESRLRAALEGTAGTGGTGDSGGAHQHGGTP